MIPVAPAQNTFRALISMNKLIMARKTRDVMSAAAPVATISAVSGCAEERNVVKSIGIEHLQELQIVNLLWGISIQTNTMEAV